MTTTSPPVRVVFSAGRFDRPLDALANALEDYAQTGGIVMLTEQDGRDAARERVYDASGLSWVRFPSRGAGECTVLWSGRWRLSGNPVATQLTDRTYRRTNGHLAAFVHALSVPLRDQVTDDLVLISAAHLPVRNTALRRAVWTLAVKGWRNHLTALTGPGGRYAGAEVIAAADWNRDFRRAAERSAVNQAMAGPRRRPGMVGRLVVPQGGGTHGPRVLDATWTTLEGASSHVLRDDPSSDHRPFLFTAPTSPVED